MDSRIDVVVVSDAHLRDPKDENGQLFLDLLSQIALRDVDVFVLLGDIFDFCLGAHPYYHKKYAPFGRALEGVVASGTRVVFLEGNHEFSIANMPWKGVEFVTEETFHLKTSGGSFLQFGHGDLIHSDANYRLFRKFIKSSWFLRMIRMLPGKLIDELANRAAQLSRAQDEYRAIDHHAILASVYKWLEQESATYGVFGHFHVPYAEKRLDGEQGGVYSLKCWDHPNILFFADQQFHRVYLKLGETWQVEKTKSFFGSKPTVTSNEH